MTSNDDELFQELLSTFQAEASEHIQTLNQALLRLERATDADETKELLQEAFRAAHSLKGSARVVSLEDVATLAHGMENVLQHSRDGQLTLRPDVCDVLYAVVDGIKALIDGNVIEIDGLQSELAGISEAVAARISQAASNSEPAPLVKSPAVPAVPTVPPVRTAHAGEVAVSEDTIRVAVSKLDNLMVQSGELLTAKISAEQHLVDTQALTRQVNQWSRTWREIKALLPTNINRTKSTKERQIFDLLEHCDEQLQRLQLDTNSLQQSITRDNLRLSMVTSRVQDEVRRVRMVPFQIMAMSLERSVRDAARIEGKAVAMLKIEGGETELDKKVLETLKDPLIHLLRNAVSHGIEAPDTRAQSGKSPEGQITLSVLQRGNEVHISVKDDGQGFDLEGLRAHSKSDPLTDKATADELISLAFEPGVSTADHITAIAGRGVGLDVVRRCMDTLQGRISVDSVPTQGSTIRMTVPVSLAMTRGLLIQIGTARFILPLLAVEKILEPKGLYTVNGQAFINLDGKPLPYVPLAAILGLPLTGASKLAVVVRVADQRVVLLVDEVLTEQEVAVKPLSKLLKQIPNVTGAALLGNGQPVIVLNAADILRSAYQLPRIQMPEKPTQAHGSSNGHSSSNGSSNGTASAVSSNGASANGHANGSFANGKATSKVSVLVVDDSITTRTLEKNILQAAGFQVITATDGTVALRQLEEHDFDVVVSDVQMPNMDGIELTSYLRETVEYAQLPIILVTSLESIEDRERGLRAGANAYIVKRGFDQAELLSTIRQFI